MLETYRKHDGNMLEQCQTGATYPRPTAIPIRVGSDRSVFVYIDLI